MTELQEQQSLLQKEYEESPFDDFKVTFDPEMILDPEYKGDYEITVEDIKNIRSVLQQCIALHNGDIEPECSYILN